MKLNVNSGKMFIDPNVAFEPVAEKTDPIMDLQRELESVYSSRSWRITKPLRIFMNLLRLTKDEILAMARFAESWLMSLGGHANLSYIAYFTRKGYLARKLKIRFSIDEQFSNAHKSISRSKFIKKSSRQTDDFAVHIAITQDISFDPYLIFKFCLEWIQRSDNSTIYCDFIEEKRAAPFVKGNWDFLYHRSISLLAPIYLESNTSCSLLPRKLEGGVVKIRNTGEYLERLTSPLQEVEMKRTAKRNFENVSIIIPTANKVVLEDGKNHWLVGDLVREIAQMKGIKPQFVIVHNGNMTRKQMSILKSYGDVKFILFSETKLNISKKINMGAKHAKYEKLVLANDDIRGAAGAWLENLLIWLNESYAGIVVPRIHYPDGYLQYAGIEIDAIRKVPLILGYRTSSQNQGYGFSFVVPRQLDAATGVLMATRKSVFDRVGGWDEELAINYNDVDYGLRVRQAGLSIVFEPSARIFHLESASRDATVSHEREERQLIEGLLRQPVTSFWPNLADYSEKESPSIGFDFFIGSIVREINHVRQK